MAKKTKKTKSATAVEKPWTPVLDAANAVPDVMGDFQPFSHYTRNGANVSIQGTQAKELSDATRATILTLFEDNMKAFYQDSDWGYDGAAKRTELFEDEARYLLVFDAVDPSLVGFAHFRFVEDDGALVLYLYEVQLASTAQRHGLGKFLMQLLLLVARKHGMELMVLTVFKRNTGAMRFYRDRLGFEIDETSPSACGDDSQDYEILSKMMPSPQQQDIAAIVSEALTKQPRLRKFQEFPRASRVRILTSNGSNPSDSKLAEESEDSTLIGVGDRLLYLLQRWQVTNVVVVVAHRDASLSARLLGGAELYKLATEAAKLALEQHYLDSVAEAAKVAAEVAAVEKVNASEPEQQQQQHLQQVIPATCVMSSNTVPTWPKDHHPTSDGGGRKGIKQGRINHFRYREATDAEKNQEVEQPERILSENVVKLTSGGGLEWLGISREEWRKLRSIRVPVRELHYLFMCLVVLLEPPIEQRGDGRKTKPTPKQQEQFLPSDFSWAHCRQVLHKSSEWSHRLRAVRGGTLAPSQSTALRAIFQEPTFTESAFVRIAGGAGAKVFTWLQRLLDEYDEKDLGMLRIDMPAPSASAVEDDGEPNHQQEHEVVKHEQTEEKGSPELRALRNVSKGLKSPSRKPFKIVDPGRLFGRHHATQ
ncbi:hypothetical protein BBJ29_007042 [Phytophthora kernoviae]|uniref:N-alpha-acetyltransferase 40 n=1 Tax=Phytophthora kernoviae TaxID=325452 RepID=A0A421G7Y7_9STRA|nr:hypothetical protein BBJ29_007042 [Phytophthora kernoviae]